MSTKEKLEERKFILECIELYERLPALWNPKSKDYSKRDIKNQQYEILLRKYNQRYGNASKADLIRKLNSLRTNFRKELKKIRDSKNSANAEEPTLWYFDQMKFLLKVDYDCLVQNSMSDDGEINEVEVVDLKDDEPRPKKRKGCSPADQLVRLATDRLKAPQDYCHHISIVWANKLSRMDRNQRIIAEKIINEVMYNGELGLLNFNTNLTNTNPVCNLRLSSSFNQNKRIINTDDSPLRSTAKSNQSSSRETNDVNQHGSIDHMNYSSSFSLLTEPEVITDDHSAQTAQNFIVEEYDILDNSIKTEE